MHGVIDRQRNHGIHFRVLAKALRISGGDHLHSGTVVGKLEGEREITLGFVDLMRDDYIAKDRSRGIYFAQEWAAIPGVMPVASGGIHVWHIPALVEIFGDDSCLQFGGGTLGFPTNLQSVPINLSGIVSFIKTLFSKGYMFKFCPPKYLYRRFQFALHFIFKN